MKTKTRAWKFLIVFAAVSAVGLFVYGCGTTATSNATLYVGTSIQ